MTLKEKDVIEWSKINRRLMWNVYPTDEEIVRYYALLPMVMATDRLAPPVNFPCGSFKDFRMFADNVDRN